MKTYLGDGVYANWTDGVILLTSEDGIKVLHQIYLEPEVFGNLVTWFLKLEPSAKDWMRRQIGGTA